MSLRQATNELLGPGGVRRLQNLLRESSTSGSLVDVAERIKKADWRDEKDLDMVRLRMLCAFLLMKINDSSR